MQVVKLSKFLVALMFVKNHQSKLNLTDDFPLFVNSKLAAKCGKPKTKDVLRTMLNVWHGTSAESC